MSSWSSSHPPPPPPRSERSRSPSRGAYSRPAYADQPYPDAYRADWDAYNRERAWAEWERERAAYDYGRRGRSRSPPYDEGRKRRRSMSPYDRERYDPRPRYEDYDAYRGYGHTSPRGRGQYSHGYNGSRSSRNGPPDPHLLDYPANLRQYADWFRFYYPSQANDEDAADKAAEQEAGDGSKPRNGIKARWEKYRKEFLASQLQILFEHHRKSPWFAEKYDPSPEYANLRARVRKVGWRGRANQFLNDLEEGKFDFGANDSSEEITSPTSPTSPVSPLTTKREGDESAAPETMNATSGADVAEPIVKNDDDFGMGVDGDEEAADNAGNLKIDTNGKAPSDTKDSSKDEVSVMPEGNQVMIRTIPPDIGRVKLEAVMKDIRGFVYLALGDPMQKRNYYRAGWIKFTEDADMGSVLPMLSEKKIEGFKLHVSHNTRPFSNKVRYAPDVGSRPERIAKDLEQAKKLALVLEEEYERVRTFKPEKAPPKDGKDGVESAADPGSDQQNGKSDSVPDVRTDGDVLMAESYAEDDAPREKGTEAIDRRLKKIFEELPEPANDIDSRAQKLKKDTIALDMYLAYLRAAFHTCYYCASISDHLEELQRKCIKHARKPLSKLLAAEVTQQVEAVKTKEEDKEMKEEKDINEEDKDKDKDKEENKDKIIVEKAKESWNKEKGGEVREWKRNDERWLEWLDNRISLLINRDGIDVRDYGGKRYEDELSKAVEPYVKQEDESKFRCKTCSKLFKASSFVEKHIVNKHAELLKSLDDLTYYNNFALDPSRIQPFSHYPPPVGNTPAPPPQAFGLQGPPGYMEHNRGAPAPYYGGAYPGAYAPYPNGHMDGPYGYAAYYPYPPAMPPQPRSLRDEVPLSAGGGRRLGDRIGGYAPGHEGPPGAQHHGIEGLPAKPPNAMFEPGPGGRRNGRGAPPPPPDAKEDPRAAAGRRVSYHDMDLVAEGDVELQY